MVHRFLRMFRTVLCAVSLAPVLTKATPTAERNVKETNQKLSIAFHGFLKEKAEGVLLSVACGDVLGAPVEGWDFNEIRVRYPLWMALQAKPDFAESNIDLRRATPDYWRRLSVSPAPFTGVTDFIWYHPMGVPYDDNGREPVEKRRFGRYTDDTQATLALASSLVNKRGLDSKDCAESYGKALLHEAVIARCPACDTMSLSSAGIPTMASKVYFKGSKTGTGTGVNNPFASSDERSDRELYFARYCPDTAAQNIVSIAEGWVQQSQLFWHAESKSNTVREAKAQGRPDYELAGLAAGVGDGSGSFGNGGAMRISPLAILFGRDLSMKLHGAASANASASRPLGNRKISLTDVIQIFANDAQLVTELDAVVRSALISSHNNWRAVEGAKVLAVTGALLFPLGIANYGFSPPRGSASATPPDARVEGPGPSTMAREDRRADETKLAAEDHNEPAALTQKDILALLDFLIDGPLQLASEKVDAVPMSTLREKLGHIRERFRASPAFSFPTLTEADGVDDLNHPVESNPGDKTGSQNLLRRSKAAVTKAIPYEHFVMRNLDEDRKFLRKILEQSEFQIETSNAVATVLFAFLRFAHMSQSELDSLSACGAATVPEFILQTSILFGGDTDTIASMVGGLVGALYGKSWIPKRWLQELEGGDSDQKIGSLARELVALQCNGDGEPCSGVVQAKVII